MCTTCGCKQPKNKHGQKTVEAANKKFAKKTATTCKKCGKGKCVCKSKKTVSKKK